MSSAAPPRAPLLIVVNPSGHRTRCPLLPLPFQIGRQADNNLVLRDSRASRNHARIIQENGDYLLEDLKSSHGVYVNSVKVSRHKLRNGDRIEFGFPDSYTVIYTQEDDSLHKLLDQVSGAQSTTNDLTKLRSLVEVARALQNSLSTNEVLTAVVDAGIAITGLQRGFLLRSERGQLQVAVGRDRSGTTLQPSDLETPIDAIERALRQRRDLLTMSFDPESAQFQPGATLHGGLYRSVICVPLVRSRPATSQDTVMLNMAADTIGVLYLDSREHKADLSSGNRELLQTLALEASTIIENARLLEEERAKQRIDEELKIAREIQMSLLPRALPTEGWLRVVGSSTPSLQVGGDCFDVRQPSPGVWSLVVSDVSGKGISSSLLAALIQGAFLFASQASADLGETLARINHFLHERTEGEKYATVFCANIHRDGVMHYANAGHCEPLVVRRAGTLDTLDTTGMPLGMLPDAVVGVETVKLEPGDKVVVFSDGLLEAHNPSGEFFEAKRLRNFLRERSTASCRSLHAALLNTVQQFTAGAPQRDDMTLVIAEYRP